MRELAQFGLQALINLEAAEKIGAARYERNEARVTHRNGFRPKVLTSKAEDLHLEIPKLREGSFFPSLLKRRRRVDQTPYDVMREAVSRHLGLLGSEQPPSERRALIATGCVRAPRTLYFAFTKRLRLSSGITTDDLLDRGDRIYCARIRPHWRPHQAIHSRSGVRRDRGGNVVSLAKRIGPNQLCTLDALHLATAVLIDADLVIAYNVRLLNS